MPRSVPRIAWLAMVPLLLCGLFFSVGHATPTRAAGPASTSVSLLDAWPRTAKLGQEVLVRAQLTANGQPVTSRLLFLLLDGIPLRTGSVDSSGAVTIPIRGKELARAHIATVTVSFRGGAALSASSASATLTVLPATVTVRTVPAVDGMPITLGNDRKTTANGTATFTVVSLGSYPLTPEIAAVDQVSLRADFVRWADNIFTPARRIDVTGDLQLVLGLHLAYRGSFNFVNSVGAPIDPASIESITLTSTGGSELTLTSFKDVWLESGTAVKQLQDLVESPRSWRLLEVMMRGTNVVNRGQQRITPAPNAIWTVNLLLYDLGVQAQDALFGNLIGGELSLVSPDGTTQKAQLDDRQQTLDFPQLPRGDYTLILKVAGLGAPTPVALSRDQTAVIRVITYLDLAVGGIGLFGITAALVWFGRRKQLIGFGRYLGTRPAAALGGVRHQTRRQYRAGLGALSASVAREFTGLPTGLRSVVVRLLRRSRAIAFKASRPFAAIGARLHDAAVFVGLATEAAEIPPGEPAVASVESLAEGDVSEGSAAESGPRLPDVIGRTWEPATPTITKGPIDRARRRQQRLVGGSRPCPNCGYLLSTHARFCNRCGERVDRVTKAR